MLGSRPNEIWNRFVCMSQTKGEAQMNKRKGILLAGGQAKRLPNKAILPLHCGKPVIYSSFLYFFRNGITDITVVVPKDSAIPDIVNKFCSGFGPLNFIEQHEPDGVIPAIKEPLYFMRDDEEAMVLCCDNVYPTDERYDGPGGPSICFRKVSYQESKELVCIRPDGVFARGGSDMALTTPWIVNRKVFANTSELEMIPFLNAYPDVFKRVTMSRNGWRDIGTLDSFKEYWRDSSNS